MSKPNQLIINDVLLTTQTRDRYRCYPAPLTVQLEMIAGNIVEETRGTVQMIEYTCDAIPDLIYRNVLTAIRKTPPLQVAYLPDDGAELVTGQFILQSITNPTLAFFDANGKPVWHGLTFVLREVAPHD